MRVSVLTKFFVLFLFSVVFLFSSAHLIFAQENENLNPSPTLAAANENLLNTNPDVKKNLHNGAQIVTLEVLSAMVCQVAGYDPMTTDHKCLGVDASTGKIGFVNNGGGMISVMGTLIGATFTPQASTLQYATYLKNNFGVTEKTYAAETCNDPTKGIGFCGLYPVLNLWIAMRNIVYMILILIFVLIGVGIMLRIHIDPRTVMTIQNQIPRIIIGIILVTFSFAIAGFLIDIMWVLTYLFAAIIWNAGGLSADSTHQFNNIISAANPFLAVDAAFPGGIGGIAGQAAAAIAEVVKNAFTGPASNFNGDMLMGFLGGILGVIIGLAAFLIFAIAMVAALVNLWVKLIMAYINIILDVVFAPFWIIAGVMPGSSLGIGAWFRDMLANLAVYPVTVSMLLLANIFFKGFNGENQSKFIPPLVSGANTNAISALIGLGFILMLPTVLATAKSFFKAPKLDLGPVFKPIQAATGTIVGAPKRVASIGTKWGYANQPAPMGKTFTNMQRVQRFLGDPMQTAHMQGKGK